MNKLLLFLFSLAQHSAFAQLNCKTEQTAEGKTTTCYHQNKRPSTVETWDKDDRWGSLNGFDAEGKEIFHFNMRKVGGYAGADLRYHANGQVSRAEFHDQPDGGIQNWRTIDTYDEAGKSTGHQDLSRPDGDLHVTLIQPSTETPAPKPYVQPVVPPPAPKPETIQCAVLMMSYYTITNKSGRTVRIKLVPPPGAQYATAQSGKTIQLAPKEVFRDSYGMAGMFIEPKQMYQPELVTVPGKTNKRKIVALPAVEKGAQEREFGWEIY